LLVLLLFGVEAEGRQIVDMVGRKVEVPERIERVLGSSWPATWMVYALDPTLLAGINSVPPDADWEYLIFDLKQLPVIGSFGGTRGIDREKLLSLRPDVVVFWGWRQGAVHRRQANQLEAWGIPVVFVELDRLDQYAAALRFLGELLNRTERAEQLAAYGDEALASVRRVMADIPADKRKRVYYAEGVDGLETEPRDSFHAEVIPLAGGINVHHGELKHYMGRDRLGLEQVLLYDPQVILVQEKKFFGRIRNDPRWQNVTALRDKKVWLVPDLPLNWFDRPPSFMRFLGLKWLAHSLYPQRYPMDMMAETSLFYRMFLGRELSDGQIQVLLDGAR
jgi:iron complex transport system substrate-binding protein